MSDQFKPGQSIKCTVTKNPRSAAPVDTIERLMRMTPELKRGLKKAQRRRRQDMVVYNRGNRDWYKREICGKFVRCEKGASWIMPYSLHIAPDLASVKNYLSIQSA
jgi:hypothetical protein